MMKFLCIILTSTLLYTIILRILKQEKSNKGILLYQKAEGVSSVFSELIKDVQVNSATKDPVAVAKELRKMIRDYDPTKPVPIIDIVKQMGFAIKIADELPNDDSGVIMIAPELNDIIGNSKCVLISGKIKYGKRRFVLAHEIGHYLFDFDGINSPRYVHNFVRSYNKVSTDDPKEQKVNKFAAELLMPEEIFRDEYSKLKVDGSFTLTDIIIKLSEFFETTTKSVETRITELGI